MWLEYITLDWDNVTQEEVRERCAAIYAKPIVSTISVRLSAIKGYHVRVNLSQPVSEEMAMRLRDAWKDDGNRLVLDIMRDKQPKMVLWNVKYVGDIPFSAGQWVNWVEL